MNEPRIPTPKQGDVLVIGTGEKATRHTCGVVGTSLVAITPPWGGIRNPSRELLEALLASGAATLEPKKEPVSLKFEFAVSGPVASERPGFQFQDDLFEVYVVPTSKGREALTGQTFQLEINEVSVS